MAKMKFPKTKKGRLIHYLEEDLIPEEQIDFLYALVEMKPIISKHEILEMAGCNPKKMNYDTATPIDYFRRIEDIYPDFKEGLYVFDYTEQTFGKMTNIYNLLAKRIFKLFQKLY